MKLYQCFYLRIILLFLALSYSLSAVQKPNTTVAAIQLHSEHAGDFQKMHELVKEAKMRGAERISSYWYTRGLCALIIVK